MATNSNTPVVWLDDGPRFILADGSVVQPIVSGPGGDEKSYVGSDQGEAMYGDEVDGPGSIGLRFVDDPDAAGDDAVEEVLAEYE